MCLFPRPLRVSLLCKAFNRDNFPKTRAPKKNPRWLHLWRAPPPYFPSYLLTKPRTAQSQSGRRSAPPLSSFERWRERRRLKKFQHTPADREGHLFQYSCSVLRTLKLKKAPLHYFRRPCHHLKVALPWFSSALQFSIVVSCKLQAGASVTGRRRASLVDFEVFFFFFCIFGKSYARGRRETKKIITVA